MRFVASQLRKMGYRRISLTPRRGDGGADIICYDSEGRKTAVQCRCGGTPVGYGAIEEVLTAKHFYKCDEACVVTEGTFTRQATDGARQTGVRLYAHMRQA